MQLTPEEQLILASVKIHPEPEDIARIESLVPQVKNWDYVVERSVKNGIAPLLLKNSEKLSNRALIPENVINTLTQTYFRTLARSMRLYDAYKKIADAFNAAGLKFIVLKGAYLAEHLYKDPGLRQFSDIDILVEENEAGKFLEILEDMGYADHAERIFQSKLIQDHLEFVHFPPMLKEDISVEVHIKLHRFGKNYDLKIPEILRDAEAVSIQGIPAYALRWDDLLIHLCVHADKHFRGGHVQFTCYNDITNLLATLQKTFDWDLFGERCRLHNCERAVFQQLMLANVFCFAPLPEEVGKNYINKVSGFISNKFIDYLNGNSSTNVVIGNISRAVTKLSLIKKIVYFWVMIFPDKTFMIKRYSIKNSRSYFLYYPVRHFDAFKAFLRK